MWGCTEEIIVHNGPPPLKWTPLLEKYEPGAMLSIWSNGPDNIWVAGGKPGESMALSFDGVQWQTHDPGLERQLWWVHAFGDGTAYVVGNKGAVARYDGSQWEIVDVNKPGTVFYGVWGSSPDDVWIVGGPILIASGEVQPEGDVLMHFDGETWSQVDLSDVERAFPEKERALFKVWGANEKDVFVVGEEGLTLHYDGQDWLRHENPAGEQTLFTVVGRDADDVYAIGGLGNFVLMHWDGASWEDVPSPDYLPTMAQGIWTAPGEPLYIAGNQGFTARMDSWGKWVIGNGDDVTDNLLHSICGDGAGGVLAAGGNLIVPQPSLQGVLLLSGRTMPAP
jgi:photosystem II stability/assembly factor-like uncharacterized protein